MVHYTVGFSLKASDGAEVARHLEVVRAFAAELQAAGQLVGFALHRNLGEPPRSVLLPYLADFVFADNAALGVAMARQDAAGIRCGLHGRILQIVADFHVEVWAEI